MCNFLPFPGQTKEKLLRKQNRQALLLDNMISMDGLPHGRSLRGRKHVSYTFGKRSIYVVI